MINAPANLDETDDAALIRKYAEQDDRDALGQLFQRHGTYAYRVALRIMRNPSEAEEAVQEAFMDAMKHARDYRGGAGVKIWLMKIVIGRCKRTIDSAVRRRKREKSYSDGQWEFANGNAVRLENVVESVKSAMDRLPERHRLSLWLHFCENLSFREVAAVLSVPESTARMHASRGIGKLRELLAKQGMAVSSLSMTSLLSSWPNEAPSAAFFSRLNEMAATAEIPVHVARPGGDTSGPVRRMVRSPFGKGILIGLPVAGSLAAGTLLFRNAATSVSDPVFAAATEGEWKWTFDHAEDTRGLTVIKGSWRHVAGAGPDGSGCQEVLNIPLRVEMDVPPFPTPWKLTYRTRSLHLDKPQAFKTISLWNPVNELAIITGLGRPIILQPDNEAGPWETVHVFISDEWIGQWMDDGRHMSLAFTKRSPNARLNLIEDGYIYLDDLTLQSISPDELPDIRPFVEALEAIPEEKRVGTVPLPRIKSDTPDKQVEIHFQAGGYL